MKFERREIEIVRGLEFPHTFLPKETLRVPAWCSGALAIHEITERGTHFFRVTHLPSRFRLCESETLAKAKTVVDRLLDSPLKWGEITPDDAKANPQLRRQWRALWDELLADDLIVNYREPKKV